MDAQPVGAMGKELGTCGIVVLQMEIDETGQNLEIPCYVLDSVKPLWQGELKDCAVLLGTNALTDLDLKLFIQMELQFTQFTRTRQILLMRKVV